MIANLLYRKSLGHSNHLLRCHVTGFGFLRSGEVTVPSAKEYDPGGHLSEGDVTLDNVSAPTLVQVRIKASKTDPFRKGVVRFTWEGQITTCAQ